MNIDSFKFTPEDLSTVIENVNSSSKTLSDTLINSNSEINSNPSLPNIGDNILFVIIALIVTESTSLFIFKNKKNKQKL